MFDFAISFPHLKGTGSWNTKIRLPSIINCRCQQTMLLIFLLVSEGFSNRSQGLIPECDTAMICAIFPTDLIIEMNFMDKLGFVILKFNLSSGGTYYIATPPMSIYIRRSTVIYELALSRHNSLLWHYKWI